MVDRVAGNSAVRPATRFTRGARGLAAAGASGTRLFVVEVVVTVTVLCLLWAGVALQLHQQRVDLLRVAMHDTRNLSRAFEENTIHTADDIDRTLLFLRSSYSADPENFDFAGWLQQLQSSDDTMLQLSIVDASGKLMLSDLGPINTSVTVADREHFQLQRDSVGDGMSISKPVRGRESGRWSIQFTRKLIQPNGSFGGVVAASVDPFRLSDFYSSVDVGRGFVVLAGLDGIVRAAAPASNRWLGADIRQSPLYAAMQTSPDGTLQYTNESGRRLVLSFRRIDKFGLVVVVAFDGKDVLAPYFRSRSEYLAGGGILTLFMLLVAFYLLRHKLRLLRTRVALSRSQQVLTDTLENIDQGILMIDARGRVPVINRRAAELLALPVQGQSKGDVAGSRPGPSAAPPASGNVPDPAWLMAADGPELSDTVIELDRPNGTVLEVRTRILADRRAVRTVTDVTGRRRAEAKLTHIAHHDGLTGLTNRTLFHNRLAQAVAAGGTTGAPFAVLFLDLDQFKTVNDTWGHSVGDELLRSVAERMLRSLRDMDISARLGGDEFAVLQLHADQPGASAALAHRLVASLAQPYDVAGRQLSIGVSIGIAIHPADGRTADQLLKSADLALYRAKEDGRGTFRFFEPEMDRRLQERTALERDLRTAIAHDQLEVVYQPICDASSRRPLAYEALARWTHPTRGPIPPGMFVPLAEETGLIPALGRSIMRIACREAATWPGHCRLYVNLSPMQLLDPTFDRQVLDLLDEVGLQPDRLGLEVTEGVLVRKGEEAFASLRALRRHGVRIALDDFGTGHAGLSYLLRFPFDSIKIDRSFVQVLDSDDAASAVIQAAVVLGQAMHIDVVAEGVEIEAQLSLLRSLGCRCVQGFLLGRPAPARIHAAASRISLAPS